MSLTNCDGSELRAAMIDAEGVVSMSEVLLQPSPHATNHIFVGERGAGIGVQVSGHTQIHVAPFDPTTGVVDPPVHIFETSPGYWIDPVSVHAEPLGDEGYFISFPEMEHSLAKLWGFFLRRDGTVSERILLREGWAFAPPSAVTRWFGEDGIVVTLPQLTWSVEHWPCAE